MEGEVPTSTLFNIETYDKEEAKHMLQATAMWGAIDSAYQDIFRPYIKYGDLSEDQSKLAHELSDKFLEHFKEFLE